MSKIGNVLIMLVVTAQGISGQTDRQRSEATSAGAILVSGSGSLSSQGGDLYGGFDGERITTITVIPSVLFFPTSGLAIGGDVSYARISQGDASATVWAVGPKAAYFFDSGASAIPFLGVGAGLLSVGDDIGSETGLRGKASGGVMVRQGHLAFVFEAGYVIDRFTPEGATESVTGNTFVVGFGFAGFIF